MKINLTKTPLENLVLQIVEDNAGLVLTAAQVTAGAPSVFGGDPQNTQVTLTAVEGQGFTGTKLVKYVRLDMNSGVAVPVTTLEVLAADNQAAVQTKVAAALGLIETELTFSAYTAAVDDTTPGTITVAATAGGLLYAGAAKTIAITVPAVPDPDLEDEIVIDELSGFDPEA
ncbi:hypothetical protein D3C85_272460 [compost metagenome]|jgi:hypothetical protein